MNKITVTLGSVVCSLILFLLASDIMAQGRVDYQSLANQQRQQNIYFDFFTLPGNTDSTIQFVGTFRMDYSFLPFKKINNDRNKERFYSSVALSMEVFKAEERMSRRSNIPIEGLQQVTSTFWKDTAYAESYQQTQSNNTFISGYLQVELQPGLYNYILQLNRDQYSGQENSRTRQVDISSYRQQRNGSTVFVERVNDASKPETLNLLNFGDNVYYGKDFYALVHIPDFDPDASYSYRVTRVETSRRDTMNREQLLEREITSKQLITDMRPKLRNQKGNPVLELKAMKQGYNYALFKVPNSEFPNAVYRIEVIKDGQSQPVSQSIFRSLWLQMPVSLLNLDVAIDMLRFIESRDTIRKLKEGSASEREQKFREYWNSKDPTPETEFNELMAEYYRRIDYAYQNFSTINTVGYESDQGQVYIKYGPPKEIERRFPSGEPAVEIWTYGGSTQFVFEATSGFGDFRLVNR